MVTAAGRGDVSRERLAEHLQWTVKQLKKIGIRPGDGVASALPEGPDSITARIAVTSLADARYFPIESSWARGQYEDQFLRTAPKLLLVHPGEYPADHPARQAASMLRIPVANVLRHFEAGVFTLEPAIAPALPPEVGGKIVPGWKRAPAVQIVLIAPEQAYRRLANRLDSRHSVVGITPPRLEHLPPPYTIQHVAAECVRLLRRFRPNGPYALAGWQAEGLIAVEMARLLEEEGEQVAFVAMLDASDLFSPSVSNVRRAVLATLRFFRGKPAPSCAFMAEALRTYRPLPWYGKILHIGLGERSNAVHWNTRFEWSDLAPHGVVSHEASSGVQTVAAILADELGRSSTAPVSS